MCLRQSPTTPRNRVLMNRRETSLQRNQPHAVDGTRRQRRRRTGSKAGGEGSGCARTGVRPELRHARAGPNLTPQAVVPPPAPALAQHRPAAQVGLQAKRDRSLQWCWVWGGEERKKQRGVQQQNRWSAAVALHSCVLMRAGSTHRTPLCSPPGSEERPSFVVQFLCRQGIEGQCRHNKGTEYQGMSFCR